MIILYDAMTLPAPKRRLFNGNFKDQLKPLIYERLELGPVDAARAYSRVLPSFCGSMTMDFEEGPSKVS